MTVTGPLGFVLTVVLVLLLAGYAIGRASRWKRLRLLVAADEAARKRAREAEAKEAGARAELGWAKEREEARSDAVHMARERMHVAETASARAVADAETARRRQANTRVHLERRSNELAEARQALAESRREVEEITDAYRSELRDRLAERDDARRQVVTLGQVVQEIRDRLESATRDAEPGHGGEDPNAEPEAALDTFGDDVQPEGHGPIDDDDAVLPDTPTHRYVSEEQLADARRTLGAAKADSSLPVGYRFTGENQAEQSHGWDSAPRAATTLPDELADAMQRVIAAVRTAGL
jgi:hypothetical protein